MESAELGLQAEDRHCGAPVGHVAGDLLDERRVSGWVQLKLRKRCPGVIRSRWDLNVGIGGRADGVAFRITLVVAEHHAEPGRP